LKANLKIIAEKADVSTATVSRVLKEFPGVREKTRKKVLKVIKKFNYEVNAVARSLRERKTNTIGIIISDVLNPFYSVIAKSVEVIAHKNGYNLILCNSDDDPEKELKYLKVLRSNRVDGILLTSTTCSNSNYINSLLDSDIPIVLMNELIDGVNCDAVVVDNEDAAYKAVKYLINNGHKRIAIIINSKGILTGEGRLKGYLRALNESKIPKNDNIIKYIRPHVLNIDVAVDLLKKENRPDAIFTTNLDATLGALFAIKKMNLKYPEEIEVAGFDDSIWYSILKYRVTTVRQPLYEIGSRAADLLFKKIKGEQSRKNKPLLIITLKTELIIRNDRNSDIKISN
jgi:DNA-binding LacI/PurR family transcriptional regulator